MPSSMFGVKRDRDCVEAFVFLCMDYNAIHERNSFTAVTLSNSTRTQAENAHINRSRTQCSMLMLSSKLKKGKLIAKERIHNKIACK